MPERPTGLESIAEPQYPKDFDHDSERIFEGHQKLIHEFEVPLEAGKKIRPERAQEVIDRIESIPEYQTYQQQPIKLSTFDTLIDDFTKLKGHEARTKDIVNQEEMLRDQVDAVKKRIEDYFQILLDVSRHQKSLAQGPAAFLRDDRELAEARARVDNQRRIVHESLLGNLRALTRMAEKIFPPAAEGNPRAKIFKLHELSDDNRSVIGSWAYNTAVGGRLERIVHDAKQLLDENKKSGRSSKNRAVS